VAAKKVKQNKQLVLLRHAKSSWDDPLLEDFDRPLAKRGRKAAKRVAEWLEGNQIRPELILCSPAARTRETLDLVRRSLGPAATVTYDKRLYLAEMEDLLARIRETNDKIASVLLIGHNPGLQDLGLALAHSSPKTGRARLAEKFPTAALACFSASAPSWAALGPGTAQLLDFIKPSDLDD
jgi:phosphohistidine phosphatase